MEWIPKLRFWLSFFRLFESNARADEGGEEKVRGLMGPTRTRRDDPTGEDRRGRPGAAVVWTAAPWAHFCSGFLDGISLWPSNLLARFRAKWCEISSCFLYRFRPNLPFLFPGHSFFPLTQGLKITWASVQVVGRPCRPTTSSDLIAGLSLCMTQSNWATTSS